MLYPAQIRVTFFTLARKSYQQTIQMKTWLGAAQPDREEQFVAQNKYTLSFYCVLRVSAADDKWPARVASEGPSDFYWPS